jgi:hypothetical protein
MLLANTMKPINSITKSRSRASKMSLTPPRKPLNLPGFFSVTSLTVYSSVTRRGQE